MRSGEDHLLLEEGWKDAWVAQQCKGDSWTWCRGANRRRYDRIYFHYDGAKVVDCHCFERLVTLTYPLATCNRSISDHVALSVEMHRRWRGASGGVEEEMTSDKDVIQPQEAEACQSNGGCDISLLHSPNEFKKRKVLVPSRAPIPLALGVGIVFEN